MKSDNNTLKTKNSRALLIMIAIISGCLLNFISCRKPDFKPEEKKQTAKAQSMTAPMQIDLRDVYDALPQSILYNLGDSATFYVGQSTYSYTDSYLVVHIPTTQDGLNYIYAAKYAGNPERTLVYAVRFFPDDGGMSDGFSGTMKWLNFQNGKASGIKYKNGVPQTYSTPALVVEPGWEQCMMDQHQFAIDDNGKIIAVDNPVLNDNTSGLNIAMVTSGGPLDCPKWGSSLGDKIGSFFSGLVHIIGGIFQGGGNGSTNNGGGDDWLPGGGWNPYPSGPPGGDPGPGGGGPTGGGGPPPGNDPPGNDDDDNPPVVSPAIPEIPGGVRYSVDDEGHGPNPGNPVAVYYGEVVGSASEVHLGGNKDANGFYYSKIMALQVYLQAHPYGMLDCGDISNMPMNLLQEIGSYQVPQSVLSRINYIATNTPGYSTSNTFIQDINDGDGVVNMDYFPVHITQMPKDPNTQQTMTPLELLEYFRKNITPTFTQGNSTEFSPYFDGAYLLGQPVVYFDDHNRFNSSDINSLGAWGHFHIPISNTLPLQNDGSIVESDYHFSSTNDYFTFTTMATHLDGTHPVAGNRRFGIQTSSQGGYEFYISGVDRVWGTFQAFLNNNGYVDGFGDADLLWEQVQENMINFVNQNGGSASYFTPQHKAARVKWQGAIKDFLNGTKTLQQLKAALNCP